MIRWTSKWLITLALVLLTGCSILGSPPAHFYVLGPVNPSAGDDETRAGRELSIEILSLRVPQYLDRPQIVTRTDANRLRLAEYHQWGGTLRKNMTRVLARNLSLLLATPRVHIAPHHAPTHADVRVDLEIMQFERGPDGQVHLSVQWRLADGGDGDVRAVRMTELSSTSRHTDNDFDGIVSAMSSLFGEMSRLMAQEIRRQYPDA